MSLRPLYDRVLIKRIEAENKIGGLFIPDSAKEKPLEGMVISVGIGTSMDDGSVRPTVVSAGDRVLFGKYAGDEIKVDGETLMIMRESEILAKIEN
jgi:chaperonin GroES